MRDPMASTSCRARHASQALMCPEELEAGFVNEGLEAIGHDASPDSQVTAAPATHLR